LPLHQQQILVAVQQGIHERIFLARVNRCRLRGPANIGSVELVHARLRTGSVTTAA
jgi:hypothetical protein